MPEESQNEWMVDGGWWMVVVVSQQLVVGLVGSFWYWYCDIGMGYCHCFWCVYSRTNSRFDVHWLDWELNNSCFAQAVWNQEWRLGWIQMIGIDVDE